ncbi:MAG TPA: DUF11 domain-containing protein [Gaiellaceae bacterium]
MLVLVPGAGAADPGVTFTSTQTLPVPPASNYAGQGGGDGWDISLRPQVSDQHPSQVYNVFHHNGSLIVACHFQFAQSSDVPAGSPCYSPVVVHDADGQGFAGTGQPGTYLDQQTYKLYVFATQTRNVVVNDRSTTVSTAGVVCFDTLVADTGGNANPFCGFKALSAVGDATNFGYSQVSDPVHVGPRWFAFNYVGGSGVSGTKNTLMCFDTTTLDACGGQPYTVNLNLGDSTASVSLPPPAIAAIGNDVIVPITGASAGPTIGCFNGLDLTNCSGWPVVDSSGQVGNVGAPVPMLTASGKATGVCLPDGTMPCWNLADGATVAPPAALVSAIASTGDSTYWNGPAAQIGPRIFVPKWGNQVNCYDFNTQSGCAGYPKSFSNLSLLYTVNSDPQRPTCLWVNSDNGGAQIQNFDAFTGGACGQGPIRLPGSFFVVDAPACTPGSYTSLQITDPAPTSYKSGNVSFADASGNALTAQPVTLDATGTADLRGLSLNTNSGLPQFLITLDRGDNAAPTSVTVKLTWTGAFDPTCGNKAGTTIVNPPAGAPSGPPPPPPTANIAVSMAGPADARVGKTATFTATVKNTGKDQATGVELTAPAPANGAFSTITPSQGMCLGGTAAPHCYLSTIASGATATVTFAVTPAKAGSLSVSAHITGDYDTSGADDDATAFTTVVEQGAAPPAPPAPTQPGTVNAISTGTVLVNGVPIPADTVFLIKAGDTVELNGFLTFTTIDGSVGTFSNVPFTASRTLSSRLANLRAAENAPSTFFTLNAQSEKGGLTDLTLINGDFATCTAPRKLSANTPNTKLVRQLWGKAKGKFRTTAKYSSATIRGTTWGVQDRCDGTLTTALDDPVDVVDIALNKTVTITGGQTYLAAAPQTFLPPTIKTGTLASLPAIAKHQTVKTVKAKGLRWAGQVFHTRAQVAKWMNRKHVPYSAFAKRYPGLAKALASRKK